MSFLVFVLATSAAGWVYYCQRRLEYVLREENEVLRERLKSTQALLGRQRDLLTQTEG